MSEQYNAMSAILDKHAPFIEKELTERKGCEWFNEDCKLAKRKRRRAERAWRKSNSKDNLARLRLCEDQYRLVLTNAKIIYQQEKINDCGNDQRLMFKIANTLLDRKKDTRLPAHTNTKQLAEQFVQYFKTKVE